MLKNNFKNNIIYLIIFILIFAADRLSKLYILNLAGMNNALDLYITPFWESFIHIEVLYLINKMENDHNFIIILISKLVISFDIFIV